MHSGKPTEVDAIRGRAPRRLAEAGNREPSPVPPERFALLQALLAYLLAELRRRASADVSSAEVRERFRLSKAELTEHLDLLNLVNFGGGCYAVYCSTENGSIQIDKELYGDTFRRPARLSPLEAKALLRALDVVAPLLAAEAHSSLDTVRSKIEGAFGRFALADTPTPAHPDAEESVVLGAQRGRALAPAGRHHLPLPLVQRAHDPHHRAVPAATISMTQAGICADAENTLSPSQRFMIDSRRPVLVEASLM